MSTDNKKETYSGIVQSAFDACTKKKKSYKVGDKFTTSSKEVFQNLTAKNRIK